jgi:ubiquinone/menaquinone biosynthesis C-methylase UbiE
MNDADQSSRELVSRVKESMRQPQIHKEWERTFLDEGSEEFLDVALDELTTRFFKKSMPVYDFGCGQGRKSLGLLKRGFDVIALDFSESVLAIARENLRSYVNCGRVSFRQGDLTNLEIADGSTGQILCWGVLMHIPDVELAISELARVLADGGVLVLSEANVASIDFRLYRAAKALLRSKDPRFRATPGGVECWANHDGQLVMTRLANLSWLTQEFKRHGLLLEWRHSGEFTEIYSRVKGSASKRMLRKLNDIWFRRVGWAAPSKGNFLVFRKVDTR